MLVERVEPAFFYLKYFTHLYAFNFTSLTIIKMGNQVTIQATSSGYLSVTGSGPIPSGIFSIVNCNLAPSDGAPLTDGVFTLKINGLETLFINQRFSDIINGATGLPFANIAALNSYIAANFFPNIGGGGGGGTPGGAATQIQYNNAGAFGADSNFVWDNTNKRVGIGGAPLYSLDNFGTTRLQGAIKFGTSSTAGYVWTAQDTAGTGAWAAATGGGGATWGSIGGTLSSQTDLNTALGLKATLISPTFTGNPVAPTVSTPTDNTNSIATDAFVQSAIVAAGTNFATGTFTGTGSSGNPYTLVVDSTPTSSSVFPVQSGGVFTALSTKMANPLTTTGDIIYSSSGSTATRLAVGGANTVLHGGTTPSYSAIVNADITNATIDLTTKITGILPISNGGTGTTTPGIVAGTNITVTGTWPNQTVNASGGGSGVTTVGTFSGSSIVNGASIATTTITFGPADTTNPGMVTTGTQTFAGAKTFNSDLLVNGLTVGRGLAGIATNTAMGGSSLVAVTTATQVTAVGKNAGLKITTGGNNSLFGNNSGQNIVGGTDNSLFGQQAGNTLTSGTQNAAFGEFAMFSNSTASNISAFGFEAVFSATVAGLSGFGYKALFANTTGLRHAAFGFQSLQGIVTANDCTGIGYSVFPVATGSNLTGFGSQVGNNTSTATDCIFVGMSAGGGMTTGNFNIRIGSESGGYTGITTGSYNTIIGTIASAGLSPTLSNNIILSDGQGNLRFVIDNNGNLFLGASGTTYPTFNGYKLEVNGTSKFDNIVVFKGYTVATLPTGVTGAVAYVTDATAPTFLGTLVGGGSTATPVFYNGSAWLSY